MGDTTVCTTTLPSVVLDGLVQGARDAETVNEQTYHCHNQLRSNLQGLRGEIQAVKNAQDEVKSVSADVKSLREELRSLHDLAKGVRGDLQTVHTEVHTTRGIVTRNNELLVHVRNRTGVLATSVGKVLKDLGLMKDLDPKKRKSNDEEATDDVNQSKRPRNISKQHTSSSSVECCWRRQTGCKAVCLGPLASIRASAKS